MRRVLVLLSAAALVAVTAPAGPAAAGGLKVGPPPAPFGRPYAVRDLALPVGATSSTAVAVNAEGLIAGEVTVGGARHAAVWDAVGRVRDLGAPAGGQSWAVDVADNGWVAGTASEADGSTWPWVWTGSGGLRRVDGLPDRPASAVALNRSGQVLLRLDDGVVDEWGDHATSGWIWTPGSGARALAGLGGSNASPRAINDRGQAAGSATVEKLYPAELVFWDAKGAVTDVTGPTGVDVLTGEAADLDEAGTLAGIFYGYGPAGEGDWTLAWNPATGLFGGSLALDAAGGDSVVSINERGQVASAAIQRGGAGGSDCDWGDQATLWTLGQQPVYVPAGACYSNSRDVNDLGEVAGTDGVAPIWVFDGKLLHVLPGSTSDSPPRVPPGAVAMNDAGLVVGTTSDGGRRRAAAWVAPRGSVSVRVSATADTYVHRALPTTSFGSDAALAGGGVDDYLGLLRFAVPPAPSGRKLVAARLHLHTGPQSFAGSRDAHVVRLVSAQWGEATTWTTRPQLGAELGHSVVGATGPDTAVAAYLDTRQVHAGRDLNLAITGGGRDSLWWASREAAPNLRPSLELIYR